MPNNLEQQLHDWGTQQVLSAEALPDDIRAKLASVRYARLTTLCAAYSGASLFFVAVLVSFWIALPTARLQNTQDLQAERTDEGWDASLPQQATWLSIFRANQRLDQEELILPAATSFSELPAITPLDILKNGNDG